MKRLLLLSLFVLLAGCRAQPTNNPAPARVELTVSAAVSLKDAFNEIGRLYETRTGAQVNFNFGASGLLQKQIEQAAPVDVFASAGAKQMDALAAKGLILADTRHDFARNELVLIVPADSSLQLNSFDQLAQTSVHKLAIGNPQTVPAGLYAQQTLTNIKLWPELQPKFILAEDVRQVLDYVARGEVEAGIVYSSDVAAANGKVRVVAMAQAAWHEPILYPIATIKDSKQADAARQFIALVLSAEGQGVLAKYGFLSTTR